MMDLVLLKSWQIVTLGALAFITAMTVVTLVAHLCYYAFPDGYGWVAAGHIIAAGVAGWFVPQPFVQAFWLRKIFK